MHPTGPPTPPDVIVRNRWTSSVGTSGHLRRYRPKPSCPTAFPRPANHLATPNLICLGRASAIFRGAQGCDRQFGNRTMCIELGPNHWSGALEYASPVTARSPLRGRLSSVAGAFLKAPAGMSQASQKRAPRIEGVVPRNLRGKVGRLRALVGIELCKCGKGTTPAPQIVLCPKLQSGRVVRRQVRGTCGAKSMFNFS
jgi:hypothetical protein